MHKTSTGIPVGVSPFDWEDAEALAAAEDSRYTQLTGYGDHARSHSTMAESQIRKPRLGEGLAFREKI